VFSSLVRRIVLLLLSTFSSVVFMRALIPRLWSSPWACLVIREWPISFRLDCPAIIDEGVGASLFTRMPFRAWRWFCIGHSCLAASHSASSLPHWRCTWVSRPASAFERRLLAPGTGNRRLSPSDTMSRRWGTLTRALGIVVIVRGAGNLAPSFRVSAWVSHPTLALGTGNRRLSPSNTMSRRWGTLTHALGVVIIVRGAGNLAPSFRVFAWVSHPAFVLLAPGTGNRRGKGEIARIHDCPACQRFYFEDGGVARTSDGYVLLPRTRCHGTGAY
jgi:hypothetical protein